MADTDPVVLAVEVAVEVCEDVSVALSVDDAELVNDEIPVPETVELKLTEAVDDILVVALVVAVV